MIKNVNSVPRQILQVKYSTLIFLTIYNTLNTILITTVVHRHTNRHTHTQAGTCTYAHTHI